MIIYNRGEKKFIFNQTFFLCELSNNTDCRIMQYNSAVNKTNNAFIDVGRI